MKELLSLLTLASLVMLIVGLVNPAVFKKWLGKHAHRGPIAALSIALLFGTSGVTAVLYPAAPTEEDEPEVQVTPEPEENTPELTLPKETEEEPKEEEEEETSTVPKSNDTDRSVPEEETETTPVEPTPAEPTPETTYEPEPTPAPATPTYECSYDKYNCGDFNSCSEVMAVFNYCPTDIHGLDGNDNDGIPCESLCN